MNDFSHQVSTYLLSIREMLINKNIKYGNSALEPLGVFSQLSAKEGLLVRIDDKLKRIKNGSLVGYLVLLKIQTNEDKYKRNRDNRLKNRIANED